jgi:L-threonylcarbamoyladenylate synthase
MFSQKIFKIVKKIKPGNFLSYKEVAKRASNKKAYRAVANSLAKNKDKNLPCHRVIKNNNEVGEYQGSFKNSWQKVALLLKEGAIGVIPTDTLYGICGSVQNKKTVEKIYKLRKRKLKKPMIILISSLNDLKIFKIKLKNWQKKFLKKIWPGKISVILKCPLKKFEYLHRGTNTLAFRVPKSKELLKILKISGPLVAPSANWEGQKPASKISEAKKYFGKNVFYWNKGEIKGKSSTLIDLRKKQIKILRLGAGIKKAQIVLKQIFRI